MILCRLQNDPSLFAKNDWRGKPGEQLRECAFTLYQPDDFHVILNLQ